MRLHVFTLQKNMMSVLALFFYDFWHRFGSTLEAFWDSFLYVFVTILAAISFRFIFKMNFESKMVPEDDARRVQKLNSPRRCLVRLLLGHPGSERGAPERHFGCSFLHLYT